MVDDRLCELLGDPDLGLLLDETVRARLKQSLASSEQVTGAEIAETGSSFRVRPLFLLFKNFGRAWVWPYLVSMVCTCRSNKPFRIPTDDADS